MFAAYILAHPLVLILLLLGVRWVMRIVIVPKSILFPVVLVLCVVGAYALGNSMATVYVLLVSGIFGYLMVKFGLPLAPFILGVILGDQIEINLVRSLMTDSNPWLFVTRPISALLLGAALASIVLSLWQHRRMQKKIRGRRRRRGFLCCRCPSWADLVIPRCCLMSSIVTCAQARRSASGRAEHDGQARVAGVGAAAAQVDVARADALAARVPQHHAVLDLLFVADDVAGLGVARREQHHAVELFAGLAVAQPLAVADDVAVGVLQGFFAEGLYSSSEQPSPSGLLPSGLLFLRISSQPFRCPSSGLFLISGTLRRLGTGCKGRLGLPDNTKVLFRLGKRSPDGFQGRMSGWHPGRIERATCPLGGAALSTELPGRRPHFGCGPGAPSGKVRGAISWSNSAMAKGLVRK